MATSCAALELVDCSASRPGGLLGRRRARWYSHRAALLASAGGGGDPPRKPAMGAACRGLLSRRRHCVTQCVVNPHHVVAGGKVWPSL